MTEEQKKIVREIVKQAKELGIDPEFAVSLANLESNFSHIPANDKESTAFGPFQVNKATAAANNVDYEEMKKNPSLAIKTGLMNLVRHAKNPDLMSVNPDTGEKEIDTARIIAAHRMGENSEFARTGDEKKIDPVLKSYLYDVAQHFPEQTFPTSVYNPSNAVKSSVPFAPASAASESAGDSNEPLSNFQQGVALGSVGAGAGALLGLTPKVQVPFKLASAYLNREALAPTVEPQVAPKGLTPEGYPVSEFEPKAQPSKPSVARKTAQDRIELGGTDEETGTSGRQRQTGYQIRTAQEAARAEEAKRTAAKLGLNPNKPLAEAGDMTATERGTAIPKTTQDQIEAEKLRKQEIQQRTKDLKLQHTEKVINALGQEWQQMAARASEMSKSPDPAVRSRAQAVMNEAMRLWNEGSKLMKTPATFGASVGAATGFSAPYALEKYQQGDTSGALQTLGTGAGIGAALATVPRRAVPAVNLTLSGADVMNRAENKDYAGALTSAVGGLGPYVAPMMLGPEIGIPVGLATAVGAPIANYVKDKYFPYKSVLDQPQ
jgi:hypothetical protein